MFSKPLLIAISATVVLVVLILLLPGNPEKKQQVVVSEGTEALSETYSDAEMSAFKSELDEKGINRVALLEDGLASATNNKSKLAYLDSLSLFWQYFKKPALSANYRKQIAELNNSEESWFLAGDAFFGAFQLVEENRKKAMLLNAADAYNEILKINPENASALNALGVVYVEGAQYLGEPPMKGIGMIRSVLEKDPENIDALVNLGYFAIKSGQFEKAVERFNRVLEIDPNHSEAYLYLTDIYVTTEQLDKAIEALNTYKDFVEDDEKKAQIETYIQDLKNNR